MTSGITDEIILAVIDKGLASLGESPKQALWFCLEKDSNFDRNKVPENLEAFQQALQRFFGLGSNFLETLFIRYLSEATGEDLSSQSSFVECVTRLRMKASEKSIKNVTIDEPFMTSEAFVEE
jgi:hypothetical protein